jgi:hypothetical protein
VTTVATGPDGDSSEFSRCARVAASDADNRAPVLLPQTFQVSEGIAPGNFLATVQATDPDGDGLNFLFPSCPGNFLATFRLNPDTGAITLSQPLNAQTEPRYECVVRVQDDFTPGSPVTAAIVIEVVPLVRGDNVFADGFEDDED